MKKLNSENKSCLACGSKDRLTIDHIIPRIYGGTDGEHNLQWLCHSCNSMKGDDVLDVRSKKFQDRLKNNIADNRRCRTCNTLAIKYLWTNKVWVCVRKHYWSDSPTVKTNA